MIELKDEGIIISNNSFQENFFITQVFSRKYGLVSGLTRKRKKSSNFNIGDFVFFRWKSRLSEQLGFLHVDVINSILPFILQVTYKIYMVNALSSLIKILLQEKDPHEVIFETVSKILVNLTKHDDKFLHYKNYLLFELTLTKDLGYGFDWSRCSVTNSKEELFYISPKTGNIVTKEVGYKYADKLFIIPAFMLKQDQPCFKNDIYNGFHLMEHIFKKYVLTSNKVELPQMRKNLLDLTDQENTLCYIE